MKANVESMSPEQIKDVKQEIRERFPDVPWPEMSQERVYFAGYDFAVPGVLSNCIQKPVKEGDEMFKYAVDGKVPHHVAFCSDQYKFIPYEVASKVFLDYIDTYDAWGKPEIKFDIFNDGSRMRAEATFNENQQSIRKNAKKGDVIAPVGGFYHGIGLDWVFRVFAGALRLVCTNGMVGHRLNVELRKKHKGTLDIGDMIEGLTPTFEKYGEQLEVWRLWGQTVIEPPDVENLIASSGFGTKHQEEILALPETSTGETLEQWLHGGKVNVLNLYNVLTQFTTHEIESDMVKVRRGEQIASAFETYKFKKAA